MGLRYKKIYNILFFIITSLFCFYILLCNNFSGEVKNANACDKSVKITQIDEKTNKKLVFYNFNNNFNYIKLPQINIQYKNKNIKTNSNIEVKKTKIQEKITQNGMNQRLEVLKFCISNGFNDEIAIKYSFPEIYEIVCEFIKNNSFDAIDAYVINKENTGKIDIINSKNGVKFDKNAVFYTILHNLTNKNDYIFDLYSEDVVAEITKENLVDYTHLKASYVTDFKNSSDSRKNNIKIALKAIDGISLNPGESLSFNKVTGERGCENGYSKAKVIKNGTFYEEYGGGVCQVSTTLYNCALLADLEIVEVHPHSLPVSYEKPCFDAMVNSGTSDLVIKNNTKKPIFIATSSKNDSCLVNIYGVKNDFEIIRTSEITEKIENYETEITGDYLKFGYNKPLCDGEKVVISKGKSGYKSVGVLEYYKDGVLVKTKKIRSDVYKPTKEVVLIG